MNAIVKQTAVQKQNDLISKLMTPAMREQIKAAMPNIMTADRMVRLAMTAVRSGKLAECNPDTVLAAFIIAAQLGLEPNTPLGECYLIPYAGSCTFQIGYKGLLQLAYRSGKYKRILADHIYETDEYEIVSGLYPSMTHKKKFPEVGSPHIYYAAYELMDGGTHFVAWGKGRIEKHRDQYAQGNSPAWKKSFDSMAKKTVLIDLLRYAPKSIELQKMFSSDNAIAKVNYELTPEEIKNGAELISVEAYSTEKSAGTEVDSLDSLLATIPIDTTPVSEDSLVNLTEKRLNGSKRDSDRY
jgi:recombination protein RecT